MKSDFKIPTDFIGQRSDHHLSDNCASSITADIRCLCPHLDAYLPKFLDTQGLGLCSDQIGSQTLIHPSKRIRRSTMSSLHLSSIIDPSCNNEKAKSAKTLDSNSLPVSKGIKYMLGEQERNLDLYLSGIIGYTPLLPSTFVEKVFDERTFEAKATKIFDASPGKCVSLETMDTIKLGKQENSQQMFEMGLGERKVENVAKIPFHSTEKNPTDGDTPMPLHVNHEEDSNYPSDIKDKILRLRKQILHENQDGEKMKSISSIPSRVQSDDTDEVLTTANILEMQKQRETDLLLANKRVTCWLETINQNRSKYWSDRKSEKACSFSCKFCLKGAYKKEEKIENLPFGDSCLQCLDCGLIACSFDYLECQNTKRHMQQHFLHSGHSLGITCGSKGEIFCMKCGDFVYNEVFDREKERIDILFQLPSYAWGRNKPLLRSFSLGDILEDFVIVPEEIDEQSHDRKIVNKVVWRGLRASYPSEVPEEFIKAARYTLKRLKIFHESFIESKPQENGNRPKVYFEKPIGIINSGNLCYMTSVLQCLFNLIPVQYYFLRDVRHNPDSCIFLRRANEQSNRSNTTKEMPCNVPCLACEFDKLMLSYYGRCVGIDISKSINSRKSNDLLSRESAKRGLPLTTSDFIVSTWKMGEMRHLAGHDQHDAHEFLQALLDKLNEDCKRMEQTIISIKRRSNTSKFSSEYKENDESIRVKTVISSFQGFLKSVLVCQQCGEKRSQNEPFVNISLPINRKATNHANTYHDAMNRQRLSKLIDVRDCLDDFTEEESLSDLLGCEWCKEPTSMLKQQTFAKLPTILCLHLKRFDAATNKKIDDPVSFPAVLNMGSYLPHWREVEQTSVLKSPDTDACDNIQPIILYDLCGTINHSGGMNQGHYVANVKIEDVWYNCNDAHVRALSSVDEVLKNNEVYMIFYTRRNLTLS